MKILIIEDEIELLIAISNFLTKEDYVCELAENFLSAEENLSIYEYDIILLDITLPNGNGLELLKSIKKRHLKSGVIIISAKNSLNDKINGSYLRADDYITKPFHYRNSRIKAVIRRRQFDGTNIISFHEITIQTDSKSVKIKDRKLR